MKTIHNNKCKMSFGKPTKEIGACPRCDELRNGATARKGRGINQKQKDANFTISLRQHNCANNGCGSVCTFGEW